MITQYKIMRSDSLSDLISVVNYQIKLGWQPLGAPFQIALYSDNSGHSYCQAMTSEEMET